MHCRMIFHSDDMVGTFQEHVEHCAMSILRAVEQLVVLQGNLRDLLWRELQLPRVGLGDVLGPPEGMEPPRYEGTQYERVERALRYQKEERHRTLELLGQALTVPQMSAEHDLRMTVMAGQWRDILAQLLQCEDRAAGLRAWMEREIN